MFLDLVGVGGGGEVGVVDIGGDGNSFLGRMVACGFSDCICGIPPVFLSRIYR